jgi:hypothetical protein
MQKEARVLDEAKDKLAARGMLQSGEHGFELNRMRDEFAVRWRDQKRKVERALKAMRDENGFDNLDDADAKLERSRGKSAGASTSRRTTSRSTRPQTSGLAN